MSDSEFTWFSILTRMILALILVFITYNPDGFSYYHWGVLQVQSDMPAKVFIGMVLLLAWALYIRSAGTSFGYMGTFLTMSFFGTFLWLIVDQGWLSEFNEKVLVYGVLVIVSWIIATGFSFSLPQRKSDPNTSVKVKE